MNHADLHTVHTMNLRFAGIAGDGENEEGRLPAAQL